MHPNFTGFNFTGFSLNSKATSEVFRFCFYVTVTGILSSAPSDL